MELRNCELARERPPRSKRTPRPPSSDVFARSLDYLEDTAPEFQSPKKAFPRPPDGNARVWNTLAVNPGDNCTVLRSGLQCFAQSSFFSGRGILRRELANVMRVRLSKLEHDSNRSSLLQFFFASDFSSLRIA